MEVRVFLLKYHSKKKYKDVWTAHESSTYTFYRSAHMCNVNNAPAEEASICMSAIQGNIFVELCIA